MSMVTGQTIHKSAGIQDEDSLTVTTSSQAYTLTAGLGYLVFENTGDTTVWMGGSTIDAGNKRGIRLLPTGQWIYEDIKETFQVYFQCASGSTTVSLIKG